MLLDPGNHVGDGKGTRERDDAAHAGTLKAGRRLGGRVHNLRGGSDVLEGLDKPER